MATENEPDPQGRRYRASLSLAALGVVYGDIGFVAAHLSGPVRAELRD